MNQLSNYVEILLGGTPATNRPEFWDGLIPWVSIVDFTDSKKIFKTEKTITEEGLNLSNTKLLHEGNIIVSARGTVGKVAVCGTRMAFNQSCYALITKDSKTLSQNYLFYLLQEKIKYLKQMAVGGVFNTIIKSTLEKIPVELPDIDTQEEIALTLSGYDDLIDTNRRRLQLLEEAARLLFREWFVYFRFPRLRQGFGGQAGHEKVRIIKDGISKTPEWWTKEKVVNVVKRIPSGELYDQKTAEPTGSVPILDQGQSGIIGYHNNEPSVTASLDNPVIVFANHTCNQRIINFPFSAIQNVFPFLPSKENYRNIYWLHYATDNLVQLNAYKGHWPEFMAKDILLPPEDLCDKFGNIISLIHKQIFNISTQNQKLAQACDLLLPRLMSGAIDPVRYDKLSNGVEV